MIVFICQICDRGIHMNLGDMTWVEVKEYIIKKDCLIIPVATCEQHGYHLPLNHDILCVEYFASILSNNTDFLVAPTINYGINLPCDNNLCGTTSITYDVLKNTIQSITDWWRTQGFRKFILLTFHGDPFHIKAMTDLAEDTLLIELYEIDYEDILEKQTTMKHACEAETSVALFLHPDKVRKDAIYEHDIPYEIFKDYLSHEIVTKPENYVGSLGYPSFASKEKGQEIVTRIVERMLSECNNFLL